MWYGLLRWLVGVVFRAVWRPEVVGRDNVPRTGPVIIASNHLSFIDSVVIPLVVPCRVRFLAKAEYFEGRGLRGRSVRLFFRLVDAVPVRRTGHRDAVASLEAGLAVLREGSAFGLYPEGTRSRDGRLYRGRTGVGWLAMASGAPVVPVTLIGTQRIQPIGARVPRVARVRVVISEPVDPTPWLTRGVSAGRARREITDTVMDRIAAHWPGERVIAYNERLAEDDDPAA
ncbi:MAG TPA: lysophospholipid acyltransferase family protein [Kineosporiaceae bacterium]